MRTIEILANIADKLRERAHAVVSDSSQVDLDESRLDSVKATIYNDIASIIETELGE